MDVLLHGCCWLSLPISSSLHRKMHSHSWHPTGLAWMSRVNNILWLISAKFNDLLAWTVPSRHYTTGLSALLTLWNMPNSSSGAIWACKAEEAIYTNLLQTSRLNFLSSLLEGNAHADGSDFLLAHPHPTSSCLSSAVCRKDAAHVLYPSQLPQSGLVYKHYIAEWAKCV